MTKNLVFLVDINTCYVSCERVFDPSLRGKPVVVLSNNDGCVIALSKEAKALGVRMGEPWFQLEPRAKVLGVIARSSNYELYGNLSDRVMNILRSQAALFEQYSIDEAFLTAPIPLHRARAFARSIKDILARRVGLPVCVGVGSTKTLAKLANRTAKKIDALGGVCVWEALPAERRNALLSTLPTGEVWGVGRRLSARLAAKGIHSIADLAAADPATLRKQFSVVLMRTALEVRGTPAIELETERKLRDQLIYSRMFSTPIETREDMRQALSIYAQRASRRLQADRQVASQLTAFCGTSYFGDRTQHHPGIRLTLPAPTADPAVLTRAALGLLDHADFGVARYARAGIMLTDLRPADSAVPLDFFAYPHEQRNIAALLEQVQAAHGEGSLGLGYAGLAQPAHWEMRRDMLSPRATTHWQELATARVL